MLDPAATFPRRLLLGRPLSPRLLAAGYLLVSARGHAPFAAFHMNLFLRHRFTPAGYECAFRCLPALFRSFPAVKGAIGISWMLDPALRDISPELGFVRETARRWGAVFVPAGHDSESDQDALMLSPKRRALYEAGQYVPEVHAFVVSRRDVLAYAGRREG